ncbi:MAG: PEP-CTERM sorting domain-containing protein [Phycisphaeraceae bacterium]|nr:PEP-CTERM sorting domain-containing protein [Phycisphaeraceae bacterium]
MSKRWVSCALAATVSVIAAQAASAATFGTGLGALTGKTFTFLEDDLSYGLTTATVGGTNLNLQTDGGGGGASVYMHGGMGGDNAVLFGTGAGSINEFQQPWVRFSFTEDTSDPGFPDRQISLFINGPGSESGGARLLAGMYFQSAYVGTMRRTAAPNEANVAPPGGPYSRVNGETVTITMGERPDGTIDFVFDSPTLGGPVMVTSPYFLTSPGSFFRWYQFEFLFRRNSDVGFNIDFPLFEFGNNWLTEGAIPEPASLGLLGAGGLMILSRRRKA